MRLRHRLYADVGDHCDVCDIDGDCDDGDCVWSARRVQCMFTLIHTVPDPHICPRSDCLMHMNTMYTHISARQWSDTDGPVRHMSTTAAADEDNDNDDDNEDDDDNDSDDEDEDEDDDDDEDQYDDEDEADDEDDDEDRR